ncbi:hypothetical protein MKW92_034061 [Papaver armeniacum]|nr:hypothetical protein MKW92_034061 [Papaver armeniacum]
MFSENHGSKNLPPKCQEMKQHCEEDLSIMNKRGGLNKHCRKASHTRKSLDDIREIKIRVCEWNN